MSGIDDMISKFNEMGTIKKIIVGCCAVYLVLMIITLLGHAILGIPLDSFTEETPTKYIDFADLDTDGDGGLSFDEVRYYDHNSEFTISDSDLYNIFERCDKNGNGLLIGGEYDHYVISVESHLKDLKAQKEKLKGKLKKGLENLQALHQALVQVIVLQAIMIVMMVLKHVQTVEVRRFIPLVMVIDVLNAAIPFPIQMT